MKLKKIKKSLFPYNQSLAKTILHLGEVCNGSNIKVFSQALTCFPTPPIKLKLHIRGRLLIATHFEQSNYLPNQKQQGAVENTISLCYQTLPTPPIKLKLHICGRLLIATHFEQSNYLPNQKQQGADHKCDFTVFIRLFQGFSRSLKDSSALPVDSLD